jgi:hypothetical protein
MRHAIDIVKIAVQEITRIGFVIEVDNKK